MHGKGVFVLGNMMDGKRFDGYWDSTLDAGYGYIIPPVESKAKDGQVVKRQKYEAAWIVEGESTLFN